MAGVLVVLTVMRTATPSHPNVKDLAVASRCLTRRSITEPIT